jgi:hypothetical protein
MKERELDYKKSMDQLLKDKDDSNRQLKMMQEGKEFGIIHPTHCIIICVIAPCQGITSGANILEEHGYRFFIPEYYLCPESDRANSHRCENPNYHIIFTVI